MSNLQSLESLDSEITHLKLQVNKQELQIDRLKKENGSLNLTLKEMT